MLEKIIALLERFVAAHELIATAHTNTPAKEEVEPEVKIENNAPATKLSIVAEKEETPKRRTRTTKAKEEAPEIDVKALRAEVLEIDDALTDGDIEEALDEFDELMDDYQAKTLKDIKEADLPEFIKKARKIVAKYYDEK